MRNSLVFLVLSSLSLACQSTPNRDKLNPKVNYMADTMFAHRRREIDIRMDSLCQLRMELYVQEAIDSLMTLELNRIDQLSE